MWIFSSSCERITTTTSCDPTEHGYLTAVNIVYIVYIYFLFYSNNRTNRKSKFISSDNNYRFRGMGKLLFQDYLELSRIGQLNHSKTIISSPLKSRLKSSRNFHTVCALEHIDFNTKLLRECNVCGDIIFERKGVLAIAWNFHYHTWQE